MSKKWTIESARSYINKVQKGKQQPGLTYCSAIDFIMNHTNTEINIHSLAKKDDDSDINN